MYEDNHCRVGSGSWPPEDIPKHPLETSVDQVKATQEGFNKAVDEVAKNSQDVKDGICTEEDEKMEPGVILFNAISETSIKILQSPSITKSFDLLSKELSNEAVKALVDLIVIAMTNSAYNAITFYDDLLKAELGRNFDIISDRINNITLDHSANKSIIGILRGRVGDIENIIKAEQIKKSYGPVDNN